MLIELTIDQIILNKYNSLFSHKNIKNVNYFQHW